MRAATPRTMSAVFIGGDCLSSDLISATVFSISSIRSKVRGKARRKSLERLMHETMPSAASYSLLAKPAGRLMFASKARAAVSLALLTRR